MNLHQISLVLCLYTTKIATKLNKCKRRLREETCFFLLKVCNCFYSFNCYFFLSQKSFCVRNWKSMRFKFSVEVLCVIRFKMTSPTVSENITRLSALLLLNMSLVDLNLSQKWLLWWWIIGNENWYFYYQKISFKSKICISSQPIKFMSSNCSINYSNVTLTLSFASSVWVQRSRSNDNTSL